MIESKKVTVNFSNLEFITKLSGVVQILAILLVFLGGVLQASKFFLDKRINSMKEDFTRNEKSQSQLVISDLQSTIKQQDQKIEQQTKQVEGYQKKLLEVELKTKPRIIPEDKLKSLRADLTKHKGVSIEITCVMGDQEAFTFSTQLKALFQSSGWTVDGVNQAMYTAPIKGMILTIKDDSAKQKAEYIFHLLKAIGLNSRGEINPNIKSDIGIVVGARE